MRPYRSAGQVTQRDHTALQCRQLRSAEQGDPGLQGIGTPRSRRAPDTLIRLPVGSPPRGTGREPAAGTPDRVSLSSRTTSMPAASGSSIIL